MVGSKGHSERLINNMHYMNTEYLFTNISNKEYMT